MSTANTRPAENAAALDVLLVDAALGPLHRFLPDMSTVKWGVALARTPRTARRLGELGAEAGRILTGTSTLAPHRADRRFTDVAWIENPLLKTSGPALPGGPPHRRAAPERGRPRTPRPCARAVLPRERRRGGRPQQRPPRQPGFDQGGHRHCGVEPGPRGQAAGQGPGLGPARAGDGRRHRLRPGRQHRRDRRRGRLPQRGAGTDPVRPADRRGLRGADAGGPAHDQQVLRDRPRPDAEPRRVRGPAGPADVRDLLAQPGPGACLLELRHLRRRHPRRSGGRRGDHGQRADGARGCLLRRHPRQHDGGLPDRYRPAGPAGRALPGGDGLRQPATPRRCPPSSTSGWRARPRRRRRARDTWTGGRWPRCSRGCGPGTWCGTTG